MNRVVPTVYSARREISGARVCISATADRCDAFCCTRVPPPRRLRLPSLSTMPTSDAVLTQILAQLEALQVSQQTLQAKVRPSCAPAHLPNIPNG